MAEAIFPLKKGATGTVLRARLKDDTGYVDLSDYESITFYARDGYRSPVINGVECEIDADQIGRKGGVAFEFDEDTANIQTGEYKFEFHGIDGDGEKHVFPSQILEPYGKLVVLESNDT